MNHNDANNRHSTAHQAAQGDNMVNTPEELGAWLRLVLTPGVGSESARRLLAAFGGPQAIFAQTETALSQVVSPKQAQALHLMPDGCADLTQSTLDWLQASTGPGRCVITLGDADYPAPLLDIPDPPLMLYALGQTALLATFRAEQALAIVGSRNPTPQGAENARAFACSLAASGLTVVSGLALGVDGAAHEGALQGALQLRGSDRSTGSLATIAVVGTGLDRVYPRQHRDLAHRIAQNGLILSEYPLGTPPLSPNFPRRNRLISGLSQATLVVEAALQSGSLITAKQALEQGRDVMAIPGSIHATQSKGCHALIKQGAKLVESAQDVLDELRLPPTAAQPVLDLQEPSRQDTPTGQDPERELLRALGHDPVGLDALQARCGWPTAQLQAQLLEMELMGLVGRLPGGLFQRIGVG
jgi:DNA processing protein